MVYDLKSNWIWIKWIWTAACATSDSKHLLCLCVGCYKTIDWAQCRDPLLGLSRRWMDRAMREENVQIWDSGCPFSARDWTAWGSWLEWRRKSFCFLVWTGSPNWDGRLAWASLDILSAQMVSCRGSAWQEVRLMSVRWKNRSSLGSPGQGWSLVWA